MSGAYYVGIDLGTTNSSIAILNHTGNEPQSKKVDTGETPHLIRTLLSMEHTGEWLIGDQAAALDRLRSRTVFSIKSELRADPSFHINLDGQSYNLIQLYAAYLQQLLFKADIANNADVKRLVLSVPVHFSETGKQVMEKAAALLGFEQDRIWFLDEPVSVLWDCLLLQGQYVLVFDFGGGTLDMAIMDKFETEDGREQQEAASRYRGNVLAKVGLDIGGDDLDDALIRYLVEIGKEQNNPVCASLSLDVFDDPQRLNKLKHHPKFSFYYQLKAVAETAKKQLSKQDSYTVSIPPLIAGVDQGISNVTITLTEFMERTAPLRKRMLSGLKQLNDLFFQETGLKRDHIDAVLLSGGSSLLSFVPDLLEELYANARIVWDEEHLQTRIARGNARYARDEQEMLVGDLVHAAYGIYNHAGKETVVVIEANEQYPLHKAKRIATTKPNQTKIEIKPMIKQGKSFEPINRNGKSIVWRMNIRPHPQAMDVSRITLTFSIDKSQTLRVSAYDNLYNSEIGVEEITLPMLK